VEILAAKSATDLTLLVYNHDVPDAEIHEEEVDVSVPGIQPTNTVSILRVDSQHANPKQKWIDLGCPEYPTGEELARIEQASRLVPEPLHVETDADGCILRFVLPPHGVASITLPLNKM
jgi:xylan 1,4-beta-xylosidase